MRFHYNPNYRWNRLDYGDVKTVKVYGTELAESLMAIGVENAKIPVVPDGFLYRSVSEYEHLGSEIRWGESITVLFSTLKAHTLYTDYSYMVLNGIDDCMEIFGEELCSLFEIETNEKKATFMLNTICYRKDDVEYDASLFHINGIAKVLVFNEFKIRKEGRKC